MNKLPKVSSLIEGRVYIPRQGGEKFKSKHKICNILYGNKCYGEKQNQKRQQGVLGRGTQ